MKELLILDHEAFDMVPPKKLLALYSIYYIVVYSYPVVPGLSVCKTTCWVRRLPELHGAVVDGAVAVALLAPDILARRTLYCG